MLDKLIEIKEEINKLQKRLTEKEAEKSIIQREIDTINNQLTEYKQQAQDIFNENFK